MDCEKNLNLKVALFTLLYTFISNKIIRIINQKQNIQGIKITIIIGIIIILMKESHRSKIPNV